MAVSSLVPASAGITVSDGNAAGWGSDAWVQLAAVNSTSASSYTFTGLSGYRKLRLGVTGIESSSVGSQPVYLVFNSDTNGTDNNYSWTNTLMQNSQTAPFKTVFQQTGTKMVLSAIGTGGYQFHTTVDIDNVSGTHKFVKHRTHVQGEDYYWGANPTAVEGFGTWRVNTAISQIDFIMPSVNNNGAGRLHVWGQV